MSGLFVKVPWHEFVDACGGMALGDGLKGCLEIGVWLDVVELAGLNQGRDARPCSAALVMTREQRVFPVEGNRADCPLNNVAVHLYTDVVNEQLQAIHVFGNVAELLAKTRLGGDACADGFEPDLEVLHQGLGLVLPRRHAVGSRLSSDCVFYFVELCDAFEPLLCNARSIAVVYFLKLAARVGPAYASLTAPELRPGLVRAL